MNTFTKTEVFLSVFVQKRSNVNGALLQRACLSRDTQHVEGMDNVPPIRLGFEAQISLFEGSIYADFTLRMDAFGQKS